MSSLFLVKCHLYNKHFFFSYFFFQSPTTQANFDILCLFCFFFKLRSLLQLAATFLFETREKGKRDLVASDWWVSPLPPPTSPPPTPPPQELLSTIRWLAPYRLDLEMTGPMQHVAQLNKLHSFQNRIVNIFSTFD